MIRIRTVVLLSVALIWLLLASVPANAQVPRRIMGCGGGEPGRLTVLSPRPVTYDRARLELEIRVVCSGGLNFLVGIDDVGYGEEGGELVPMPDANPGCPKDRSDCWLSLTAAASDSWERGTVRYIFHASPGDHTLLVRHALGTRPPHFRQASINFSVAGSALPATGVGADLWC